jgi:chromosome segregation ATPase
MNRYLKICLFAFLTLSFLAGCATTQEITTSVKSKVSSLTSTVDPAVVNQIPADKKEGFAKAEFDLNAANQKVKLAEKKTELASAQKKYADLEEDLTDNFQKEAEIDYDLVKIEAIIKSGLGKKEDNPKIKAESQSNKLKTQADRIKINAKLEAAEEKVNSLTEEVKKMDEAIQGMKFEGGKASAAVPEPKKEAIK